MKHRTCQIKSRSFCVFVGDENLFSCDHFLELHEMEKTDVISIASCIKDKILQMGFDSEKLWGHCYDSCATTMGKEKGIATQIKKDIQPLALSIHCHTHSQNLACGDWIRNVVVSKSLDTSCETTKSVKFSPKRYWHLQKAHEEECYEKEENCSSKFRTLRLLSRATIIQKIFETNSSFHVK